MLTMGIDPDLHSTSIAILEDHHVRWITRVSIPKHHKGKRAVQETVHALSRVQWPEADIDRIAIEGQQHYLGVRGGIGDASGLLDLALVAGAVGGILVPLYPGADVAFPLPATWKGQVPKEIHHARILRKLNLEFTSSGSAVYPKWEFSTIVEGDIPPTKMHHVLDAVGLALWAQTPKADHCFRFSLPPSPSRS